MNASSVLLQGSRSHRFKLYRHQHKSLHLKSYFIHFHKCLKEEVIMQLTVWNIHFSIVTKFYFVRAHFYFFFQRRRSSKHPLAEMPTLLTTGTEEIQPCHKCFQLWRIFFLCTKKERNVRKCLVRGLESFQIDFCRLTRASLQVKVHLDKGGRKSKWRLCVCVCVLSFPLQWFFFSFCWMTICCFNWESIKASFTEISCIARVRA